MQFHRFAEIFPLMEGAAFDELFEDFRAYGVREKVVLFQGKILDGRNRFLAAQKAGIKWRDMPKRTFRGSEAGALALVISSNKRRHMTAAELAFAANRIATLKLGANQHDAEEGAPPGAPSQAEAAKSVGASRRSVQRVRKITEHGSEALRQAAEH